MLDFNYILTTEPHTIRAVFVSDLHLSTHTPELNNAFMQFLQELAVLQELHYLFILGDFLDAWAGDDEFFNTKNHWLNPIIDNLKHLKNTNRYLMHGNRDFMIGKALCQAMNIKSINEPYYFHFNNQLYRLEHGDKLCTDDKKYQLYRKIIRNPIIKFGLSQLPLSTRQQLAGTIKHQANNDKKTKSDLIMDTNELAVKSALKTCDVLIHGHTHRPHFGDIDNKQKMVLGDWRMDNKKVIGEIGVLLADNELVLCQVGYSI